MHTPAARAERPPGREADRQAPCPARNRARPRPLLFGGAGTRGARACAAQAPLPRPAWLRSVAERLRFSISVRGAPVSPSTPGLHASGYGFGGISTLLMTWMTPFEAMTSALITCAPPT